MQNFGQNPQKNLSRTSILTELSNGNVELGEAFALILSDMVVQSGITNPESEPFDVVPDSAAVYVPQSDWSAGPEHAHDGCRHDRHDALDGLEPACRRSAVLRCVFCLAGYPADLRDAEGYRQGQGR